MKKDFLGKDYSRLSDKKLYLFDMDGTIYLDNDLFEGVDEFLKLIESKGLFYDLVISSGDKSLMDHGKKTE